MERILISLISVFAFSLFDGCVTDSKSGDKSGSDTIQMTRNGARKPRAP